MKSYEEMAKSVLMRIEEYERQRKKKQTVLKHAAIPVSCVCLAAVIVCTAFISRYTSISNAKPHNDIGTAESRDINDIESTAYTNACKISIPKIEIPQSSETVSSDMVGLVVYKGKIYTQAGAPYENADNIVGNYLGYATGKIDEWSDKDEYSKEFASNYAGDVYSVKGYSEDFRICVVFETDGTKYIQIMENLNGIELNTGKDLFGDRMDLSGHVKSVLYQTHSDWYISKNNLQDPMLTQDEVNSFIDALYSGKFENIYEKVGNLYDSTVKQTHLYLILEDGLVTELRLFEGGYVQYDALGAGYCVKISGPAFDNIFDACRPL